MGGIGIGIGIGIEILANIRNSRIPFSG